MGVPAGTIFAWGGNAVPTGYLLCNGASYKRNKFKDLFGAIGTIWGGDAADEFKVPDFRGRFLRGVDHGVGRDLHAKDRLGDDGKHTGDATGSVQDDTLQGHRHDDLGHTHNYRSLLYQPGDDDQANQAFSLWSIDHEAVYSTQVGQANISGPTPLSANNVVRYGEETRPKNAYIEFIIKATNA
jgi:microcystin-dependent protein